jgi:hypothetical protein
LSLLFLLLLVRQQILQGKMRTAADAARRAELATWRRRRRKVGEEWGEVVGTIVIRSVLWCAGVRRRDDERDRERVSKPWRAAGL